MYHKSGKPGRLSGAIDFPVELESWKDGANTLGGTSTRQRNLLFLRSFKN